MRYYLILFISLILCQDLYAQYSMSNQTVYSCDGTLTDSEANTQNSGWYDHNENYSFTICPNGVLSITINFSLFSTEPVNDYVMIYDGPDNTYPILGGPYSGTNLPPQINSTGCVTIDFISDVNVADEGFVLSWQSQVAIPPSPNISLPVQPNCSSSTFSIQLDQNIHCDSVSTAFISVGGQINQTVNATPLNCINDSTNSIQLDVSPGLNQSGSYNIYLESMFKDACDSLWDLSSSFSFDINDCPLEVELVADDDSICLGDCVDLNTIVNGGDATTYNYSWNPGWSNSPGPWTVCPTSTTQYIVTVSDLGPATSQSDTITIFVSPPPSTQLDFSICNTDSPTSLSANPPGGWWYGPSITNGTNPLFHPQTLIPGVYTVNYSLAGCEDDLNITILEINAGADVSACLNAPIFNLNSIITTPGGTWSSPCNCIQSNGDINVGGIPTIIPAIYTLPNGCSDTLFVDVGGISVQADDTLCQQSGNYPLTFSPSNGTWSVLASNPIQPSICLNSIEVFPYQESFELGFVDWIQDPANDFDWTVNSFGTPSGGTGPNNAFDGDYYIYTESSNPNHPTKTAAVISPCLNLSAFDNPALHFWYHKQGAGQGSFAVDVSIDNGITWNSDYWYVSGDMGSQWQEAEIDLSSFNSTEVRIRLRVITGSGTNGWQSDVAVDKLSVLGGPVTPNGNFLSNTASSGIHNLIYTIEGCSDFVNILVNEISAGTDQIACPLQSSFNLSGQPVSGIWNGTHITNNSLGTFDPSLGIGNHLVTYAFAGCIDTAEILVIDTDIQVDSITLCINQGNQQISALLTHVEPDNGFWNGPGITLSSYPGELQPNLAGSGIHTLTYTANSCSDDLIVTIYPKSILFDTLICSSSPDIILNASPAGGDWYGNGIINNNTGLFSPSSLGIGSHLIGYVSPEGCVDTFSIEIYNSPVLSMSGIENYYCFIDSAITLNVNPPGGILSGNGIYGLTFNPSLAGSGYHNISYSFGSGICEQIIDTVIFVDDELNGMKYQSKDTICVGDLVNIGINASGGTGNYNFTWDNSLSSSFQHIVSPTIPTIYNISISDGCSDDYLDSIYLFVHPNFSVDFNTSSKKCFGENGYASALISPSGDYSYQWLTNPIQSGDSLIAPVNRNYTVTITDNNTQCTIEDTITIPGYDLIRASFFSNNTECVSLLDAGIQFLDNSTVNPSQLSPNSYWNFGDSTILLYQYASNPTHIFADTGIHRVTLNLINQGGCIDVDSLDVCVLVDQKIFTPNSFSPDGDNCNDEFYTKGAGFFDDFEIRIYQRWGSEPVFISSQIEQKTHANDGNNCNNLSYVDSYFKMGSWNGKLSNGNNAPNGVYVYIIEYRDVVNKKVEKIKGTVTLIR